MVLMADKFSRRKSAIAEIKRNNAGPPTLEAWEEMTGGDRLLFDLLDSETSHSRGRRQEDRHRCRPGWPPNHLAAGAITADLTRRQVRKEATMTKKPNIKVNILTKEEELVEFSKREHEQCAEIYDLLAAECDRLGMQDGHYAVILSVLSLIAIQILVQTIGVDKTVNILATFAQSIRQNTDKFQRSAELPTLKVPTDTEFDRASAELWKFANRMKKQGKDAEATGKAFLNLTVNVLARIGGADVALENFERLRRLVIEDPPFQARH